MTALLQALTDDALGYHDLGLIAVPMLLRGDVKRPLVPWKRYRELGQNKAEIVELFKRRPKATGVAVATGNGIGIADLDRRAQPGGYEQWCERNPTLARELPTVRTLDGFHVWHRTELRKTRKCTWGEYRAGPTLSVGPHSLRDSFRYEWIVRLTEKALKFVPHEVFTGKRFDQDNREVTEKDREIQRMAFHPSLSFSVTCVEDAIARTQPKKVGERNQSILSLARALKFNLGMAGAGSATLHPIVRRWHARALSVIGTPDLEITLVDFDHAFERARHPLGLDLVDQAAARVDPCDLPEPALRYEGPTMRRLVALCYEMARMNGGRFFLSCADAVSRLNVTKMQVWRLLRMLETDQVIVCEQRGNEYQATRYRFTGLAKKATDED